MTQEQLDRMDYLTNKGSWKIEELGELDRLYRLFYKTFRHKLDCKKSSYPACIHCGSHDACLC